MEHVISPLREYEPAPAQGVAAVVVQEEPTNKEKHVSHLQ